MSTRASALAGLSEGPPLGVLAERLSPRALRVLTALAVAGLTLVFIALAARALGAQLWVDEGISVGIASHPLSAIPGLLRHDGSPPLYYVLLHWWIAAFGRDEVALHDLSALLGALIVPACWWSARSLFGARAGLAAAALAATSPFLVAYGGDARMYTLVALLALIAVTAFVHAYVGRRRRFVALFAPALALTLYAHNWGLFLGLGLGLAWLALVLAAEGPERRALLIDGVLGFGITALLYLPWLPTLVYQASHTGAPWAARPTLWSLTHALYTTSDGRGPAVAILLGAGTGALALWRGRAAERVTARSLGALVGVCAVTLLIAWIYSKTTPAWADRYLAIVVAIAIVAVAAGISRAGRLGAVALVLVIGYWVLDARLLAHARKTNLRSVAALTSGTLRPGDVVVATQPEQLPALRYYLPGDLRYETSLGIAPDPTVMDWRDALARLRAAQPRSLFDRVVAGLPRGGHVLLVAPLLLGNQAAWTRLVNRRSGQWIALARHDPHLRLVAIHRPISEQGTFVAASFVTTLLFERV